MLVSDKLHFCFQCIQKTLSSCTEKYSSLYCHTKEPKSKVNRTLSTFEKNIRKNILKSKLIKCKNMSNRFSLNLDN